MTDADDAAPAERGEPRGTAEERQALLLALTTEQFVLQSTASATVNEGAGQQLL